MTKASGTLAALIVLVAACQSSVPSSPNPNPTNRFVAVAAGEKFACGVEDDGDALCWGENDHGQIGDGTLTEHTSPNVVGG